jgi:hypothetical protein
VTANQDPRGSSGAWRSAIALRILAVLTFAGPVVLIGTVASAILLRLPPNQAVVIVGAVCYGFGWATALVMLALEKPSEQRDRWLWRVLFFNGTAAAAYLWSRGSDRGSSGQTSARS